MKSHATFLFSRDPRQMHQKQPICPFFFLVLTFLFLSTKQSYAQDAGGASGTCSEQIPEGATKPILLERVLERAHAGALIELEIVVQHSVGETATLPANLPAQFSQGDVRIVNEHLWGRSAPPKSVPDPANSTRATTLLKVPFVILSQSIQRTKFTLPSLRVVVLRKSGGDISVCTQTHEIEIEQPIANTPDPEVRPNPQSLPQITRNERAMTIATYSALGVLAGAILTALLVAYLRRPKAAPPPPPPRDPWRVALDAISIARDDFSFGRIEQKIYYDQLSDALRLYLGRVFAFDGLELTTDEIVVKMRQLASPLIPTEAITLFLQECDLVKFAEQSPSHEASIDASREAERIVRMLMAGGDTHWFKPPSTNAAIPTPPKVEMPLEHFSPIVESPLHSNEFVLQNASIKKPVETLSSSEPEVLDAKQQLNLFEDAKSTSQSDATQTGGKP